MSAPDWLRVKEVFTAAIEMAESERAAYLKRVCAGDALLQGEVESLLASHQRTDGFLEGGAITEAAEQLEEDLSRRWLGQRIGAYVLTEELGRGGMGLVFRARRVDGQYQSEVAIKLVRAGCESQSVLKRFLAERQILAGLVHPGIARLLDGGTTAENLPYLVMELVEGKPIDEYCAARELSIAERLRLFGLVCDAVSCAHRHLVVHRDLKPSNILITRDRTVKLLDFGVAKVLDSCTPVGPYPPTVTLLRALTVNFASPEQIRGEQITTVSDVYSLGVLLYHLLTGGSPYRTVDGPASAVAHEVCEQCPPLPSTARLHLGSGRRERAWRAQLKGDLDSIAMRALQKDPARRYPSVDLLAADLRRHLDHRPVLARGNARAIRVIKFIRRHRLASAASAAAVLTVVFAAVFMGAHDRMAAEQTARRLAAAHRTAVVLLQRIETQSGRTAAETRESNVEPLLYRLEALAARGDQEGLRRELDEALRPLGLSGADSAISSREKDSPDPSDRL